MNEPLPAGTRVWARQTVDEVYRGPVTLEFIPALFAEDPRQRRNRHRALANELSRLLQAKGLQLHAFDAPSAKMTLAYSYASQAHDDGWAHVLFLTFGDCGRQPGQDQWEGRLFCGMNANSDIWPLVPSMFSALLWLFPDASPRAD